jgi:hypothetical protein
MATMNGVAFVRNLGALAATVPLELPLRVPLARSVLESALTVAVSPRSFSCAERGAHQGECPGQQMRVSQRSRDPAFWRGAASARQMAAVSLQFWVATAA